MVVPLPLRLAFAAIAALAAAALVAPTGAAAQSRAAEAKLDRLVDAAIRGHQLFTPKERAVIERACGYAPGEWNGTQVNMIGDTFYCTNGRRVSSPEVRAVMAAVSPRIDAYVDSVMKRPEIVAAIRDVVREADGNARVHRNDDH